MLKMTDAEAERFLGDLSSVHQNLKSGNTFALSQLKEISDKFAEKKVLGTRYHSITTIG